ncbi:MAG TPA: nuclear transport factor 2 family protein [Candidatus Limnocylindria bacterium]|nr:nuclear transport factor 2 family protein [Candidatus Limnocylindria bacterium]
METIAAARQWADAWKSGWEALDPEPILERYAEHAVLSTEPFREPYRGREGVRAYVERVLSEEDDPRVWMGEPIVDGRRAAVSWWASLTEEGAEVTLAGTSVLSFDDAGLVVEQWDAWNQTGRRLEPPDDIGPFGDR